MHEGHYFVPPPYEGVTTMLRRKTLSGRKQVCWVGEKNLIYSDHKVYDEPDYDANNPIIRGGQPVVELEYLTDAFTREAVDFIDRHVDKPFFLLISHAAVHSPLQGANGYMSKFSHIEDIHRRIFAAMLANMDDSVGEVLKQLRKSGLQENTIVFFLSDNGGPTAELTSSNLPLRGEKSSMYEGALQVPFMVQWKGVLPEGMVYEQVVSSLDIYATAVARSGATAPDNIERVDLIPYLTGERGGKPHETLFWRQDGNAGLRHGDLKLVRRVSGVAAGTGEWELYDFSGDIPEENNMAGTHPQRLSELVAVWEEMNGEMRDPMFGPGGEPVGGD